MGSGSDLGRLEYGCQLDTRRVPNGPADTATFGLSNTTDVSISANTEVNGITFTAAATNPYVITVNPGVTLTLSGTGITNNSGRPQTFRIGSDDQAEVAQIHFTNSAHAGNAIIDLRSEGDLLGGSAQFSNRSSAGSATIITATSSSITFFDHSTAGNASVLMGGQGSSIQFFNASTAGSADISGGLNDSVGFNDHSTAGSATIGIGDDGFIDFSDHSSAGDATIFVGPIGIVDFADFSTAGSAIIRGFGMDVSFSDASKGGTTAITLLLNTVFARRSSLDISRHNPPGVTIGSLEDDGTGTALVFLGANNLTVGSNNLSTTFSGVIKDGGLGGGVGGSLTKIGTGTFTLTGANTYTGDTNVNRGVLQVDGSITSNTLVNRQGTLTGTGTIHDGLTNQGTVSPGSPTGTLTVDNFTQANYAKLMIQIANTNEFGVLNVLGAANLAGRLDTVLLNGFVPAVGDSFTFLTAGVVNGTLFMRNRNIDDLPLHWEISYFPTFAVLTVAAGNVSVPDAGSTLLLLVLALAALLMCRRLSCELRN
jgi:autotransporter-associated beta strand protein